MIFFESLGALLLIVYNLQIQVFHQLERKAITTILFSMKIKIKIQVTILNYRVLVRNNNKIMMSEEFLFLYVT